MHPIRACLMTAAIAAATAGSGGAALADFDRARPMGFRDAGTRMAQVNSENLRITAEQVSFNQQIVVESLQRGQNLNNVIFITQTGNGSIDFRANQTSSGNQSIDNRIRGSIGW
jgi:hypothetical protein